MSNKESTEGKEIDVILFAFELCQTTLESWKMKI